MKKSSLECDFLGQIATFFCFSPAQVHFATELREL